MPELSPFRGIRYDPEASSASLDELTAPPYDVIDDAARTQLASLDEHAAVHVSLPVDSVPGAGDRYAAAAQRLRGWLADGTLVVDPPGYYVYKMGFRDELGRPRQTSGVLGVLALDIHGDGSVLLHERTMRKAKQDRLELLRATRTDIDPIWVLSLSAGLGQLCELETPPIARCTDADGVHHRLYAVEGAGRASAIADAMAGQPALIADGHHRYETALAYYAERAAVTGSAPSESAPGILAFATELADDHLCVRAIHRLVGGLARHDLDEIVKAAFEVALVAAPADDLGALREAMGASAGLGLVTADGLAVLLPRADTVESALREQPPCLRGVDATLVATALAPAIEAQGGALAPHHDPVAVMAAVRSGSAAAGLLLRPPTVAQIRAVAEAGERMPQKTSFFWPKPRTGFVFRSLDDG